MEENNVNTEITNENTAQNIVLQTPETSETPKNPVNEIISDFLEDDLVETVDDSKKEKISKKRKFEIGVYDIVSIIMSAFIIITFLFVFAFRIVAVSGESMEDTLHNKDWLITMHKNEYNYGDIVVITASGDLVDGPLIKRVIASEGQTVDFNYSTATVFVDGVALDENYVKEDFLLEEISNVKFPFTVPKGELFCMGDNRNHSTDSRVLGSFDKKYVSGKVVLRILPIGSFNVYENFNGEK